MNKSLFFAAVVLFSAQVLDATPTTIVSSFNNSVGTRTVTSTKTLSLPSSISFRNSLDSGNQFGNFGNGGKTLNDLASSLSSSGSNTAKFGNFGNGPTVTVAKSSSLASDIEKLKNYFGNNGQSVTVTQSSSYNSDSKGENNNNINGWHTEWSSGGEEGDKNGKSGKDDSNNSWHAELNFGNKNAGGCKTCNHDKGKDNGKGNDNGNDSCYEKLMSALADIALLKLQLQNSNNEHLVMQTTINQINVELQSWKTQYQQISISYDQLKQVNVKLEFNLQQSQTTIINLQTNIEQNSKVNQGNEKELVELKHNYEIHIGQYQSCKKNVDALTSSNVDLNKTVTDTTDKLTKCQASNDKLSTEVSSIKRSWEITETNLSTCELEKFKVERALECKIDEFNEDEKRDLKEKMLRQSIQANYAHCQSKLDISQQKYENEQTLSDQYRKEIETIQNEQRTVVKKYETTINNQQTTINECTASLQTQVELRNSCIIENKNYVLNINDITYQHKQSEQAFIEAQSQIKSCRDDVDNYKNTINTLQITVNNQTKQLTGCGSATSTLQSQLLACQSVRDNCLNDLNAVTDRLDASESENIRLGNENSSLIDDYQQCKDDLSTLQCSSNKYLHSVRQSYDKSHQNVLQATAILDKTNAWLTKFELENDISCSIA